MVHYKQINLHHRKAAAAVLLTQLEAGKIDVVLIKGPWIVSNICALSTPLYKLFNIKCKGKPRSWILIRTQLSDLTTVRGELDSHH